jgi:hypothetical protein
MHVQIAVISLVEWRSEAETAQPSHSVTEGTSTLHDKMYQPPCRPLAFLVLPVQAINVMATKTGSTNGIYSVSEKHNGSDHCQVIHNTEARIKCTK